MLADRSNYIGFLVDQGLNAFELEVSDLGGGGDLELFENDIGEVVPVVVIPVFYELGVHFLLFVP